LFRFRRPRDPSCLCVRRGAPRHAGSRTPRRTGRLPGVSSGLQADRVAGVRTGRGHPASSRPRREAGCVPEPRSGCSVRSGPPPAHQLCERRHYQQAQLGYIRAKAQHYQDTIQLLVAMGGGCGTQNRFQWSYRRGPNSSRVQVFEKRLATNPAWRCSAVMSAAHRKKAHHLQGATRPALSPIDPRSYALLVRSIPSPST
jgi:hypothetical protein